MDEDSKKLNLQTVEELVLDEEKLVTYIYLSKKLCIHVNESKELLSLFVEKCKKNKTNLRICVNYLVSGLLEGDRARTHVCSEDDLERAKEELKCVFFEHIYSVSKGGPAADNVTMSAINNFSDFQSCLGLIISKSCQKHSDTEINKLKNHSHESSLKSIIISKTPSNLQLNKKPKQEPIEDNNKSNNEVSAPIKSEIKTSPKKTSSSPSTKNKTKSQGIGSFFNKQTPIKHMPNKPVEGQKLEKEDENKEKIEKPIKLLKEESPKIEIKVEKEKSSKTDIKIEKKIATKTYIKVEKEKEPKGTEAKIDNKTKVKSKKPIEDIKKNAKVDKKRKRVLHLSDSESDDQNDPFSNIEETAKETIDSEDEIPPTPTNNVVKITSGVLNPKKRRKLVDKVYTDEDGYILTKKEEVYESCSDNDEPMLEAKTQLVDMKENIMVKPSPKKINPSPKKEKKSKKKISPPQKGKQATLMNFFTKK